MTKLEKKPIRNTQLSSPTNKKSLTTVNLNLCTKLQDPNLSIGNSLSKFKKKMLIIGALSTISSNAETQLLTNSQNFFVSYGEINPDIESNC
jgi:hypothetical protein